MDAWLSKIASLAPTIASVLGSPIAGIALQAIGSVFIPDEPKPTLEQLKIALNPADPAMKMQIQQAESDLILKLKEYDIRLEDIDQRDRDSARNREIQLKDYVPSILAYFSVGSFAIFAGVILFCNITASDGIINLLIGMFGSNATAVLSYYFGSSHRQPSASVK